MTGVMEFILLWNLFCFGVYSVMEMVLLWYLFFQQENMKQLISSEQNRSAQLYRKSISFSRPIFVFLPLLLGFCSPSDFCVFGQLVDLIFVTCTEFSFPMAFLS